MIRQISYSRNVSLLMITLIMALAFAGVAQAAEAGKGINQEALFLLQIVVLVAVGRIFGEIMVRMGQPSIMGQIIGGILLGPSILGAVFPEFQAQLFPSAEAQESMTGAVAQLGILLLLLLAGMETDLGLALKLRRSAFGISLAGIVIPFGFGFMLGELIPNHLLPDPDKRLISSLFLGTALSISSVKIVASVVREMDFMRRNIGQLIVASAIIDDTIGWIIIALTFSLARSGEVNVMTVATSILGTLAFMAVSFTIGRRLVFEAIRLTNDRFKSDLPVLSAIIAIMGVMAMITDFLGVHTVLGAFVAGILVGESPILTRQIDAQLRALTTALFMPVFFGLTGLHTDLRVLADPDTFLLTVALILVASLGKFSGAFAGAKFNGFTRAEALALGTGMNARGSTEVIIATIGLSAGVLDERLFSAIVAMAVVTTMVMPTTLRWALARLPLRVEEEERLQKEEYEERSFVGGFERILLAADLTASSDLAARITGYLAATRNMPITVLSLADGQEQVSEKEDGAPEEEGEKRRGEVIGRIVENVRAAARPNNAEADGKEAASSGSDLHIVGKENISDLMEELGKSAEQGHDLLVVGVEPVTGAGGGFDEKISLMRSAFKGTAIIAAARGRKLPEQSRDLRMLIAVSDTERSLKAVEFAFLIAKAAGCAVSVIYIQEPSLARRRPRFSDVGDTHLAVFERIDEIADFAGIEADKTVQEGDSPEVAILRHARRGRYNLIFIGVSRRTGGQLSYGRIAETMLETADRSIIFVETD